jgi:hypothetical protein
MSASRSHLEPALHRILQELDAYLPDLLIIGGWVPYLYKWYGTSVPWQSSLSFTSEVDVLAPNRLTRNERPLLREILDAAHFRPAQSPEMSAIWEGDVERGERIEFFVVRNGPLIKADAPTPIADQQMIGAIPLDTLDLLQRNAAVLAVPTTLPNGDVRTVQVRVPQLGAYALNKCQTFNRRLSSATTEGAQKRVKDLLYLRDLMAAGNEVVKRIRHDIANYLPAEQHEVDSAINALHLILRPPKVALFTEVGHILAERDGINPAAARADVQGYLTDLAE